MPGFSHGSVCDDHALVAGRATIDSFSLVLNIVEYPEESRQLIHKCLLYDEHLDGNGSKLDAQMKIHRPRSIYIGEQAVPEDFWATNTCDRSLYAHAMLRFETHAKAVRTDPESLSSLCALANLTSR